MENVHLVQGHNLSIDKPELKFVVTIGRPSSGNLHMMSEHRLTGMTHRAKKMRHTTPISAKPIFMIQTWKKYYNQVIKPKDV
ncbi:hypothetical protein OUZ56_012613 [Daphnia magna]|uniref:Uncharacterized protein n=1 Tax=Daphnia magna TaxID=35525 RepID=A0ABQ9Z3J6_9CRUS|nr:hypothetical protein OUZ56_012613 [Daphnia magna]